jgi:hypothetical protein
MNTMKAKYQMIFLMDTEDKLWNIPISLHHKVPEKFGIEGIYLSILRTNYNKSKAKIALNGKKSEFISSKVMKNARVYAIPNIIQHTAWNPIQSNKAQ